MDPKMRKHVLRLIPYALYVATARHQDQVAAALISWVSQASFKPPLMMMALKADGYLLHVARQAGGLAINILGSGQKALAARFIHNVTWENGRLNGYAVEKAPATGALLLLDAPAWFEIRITDLVERGDHTVVVGEVVNAGLRDPQARPLLLADTGWHYGG